jgi:hypothetical protein
MYLVQGLRSQPRQLRNPPATALGGPDVTILLGLGIYGASKAGYRPFQAAALGVADAAFGLVVIAANALLK